MVIVMRTFESFMLERGLYGNIFLADYSRFEGLSTYNTWFKSFWEYSRHLDINVRLHPKFLLHPARVGDKSLTEMFSSAGYKG